MAWASQCRGRTRSREVDTGSRSIRPPIVDVAADYAIAAELGRPVPTIDIRVDYHKAAMPGDLTAKARAVRMGGQFSTTKAYLYDKDGALVASGRGTYFTAPPK